MSSYARITDAPTIPAQSLIVNLYHVYHLYTNSPSPPPPTHKLRARKQRCERHIEHAGEIDDLPGTDAICSVFIFSKSLRRDADDLC